MRKALQSYCVHAAQVFAGCMWYACWYNASWILLTLTHFAPDMHVVVVYILCPLLVLLCVHWVLGRTFRLPWPSLESVVVGGSCAFLVAWCGLLGTAVMEVEIGIGDVCLPLCWHRVLKCLVRNTAMCAAVMSAAWAAVSTAHDRQQALLLLPACVGERLTMHFASDMADLRNLLLDLKFQVLVAPVARPLRDIHRQVYRMTLVVDKLNREHPGDWSGDSRIAALATLAFEILCSLVQHAHAHHQGNRRQGLCGASAHTRAVHLLVTFPALKLPSVHAVLSDVLPRLCRSMTPPQLHSVLISAGRAPVTAAARGPCLRFYYGHLMFDIVHATCRLHVDDVYMVALDPWFEPLMCRHPVAAQAFATRVRRWHWRRGKRLWCCVALVSQ